MPSKSNKESKDGSVLSKINSDVEETSDQQDHKTGNSVLAEINEDQSEKKSDTK